MRKTTFAVLGALLIAGSAAQITAVSARPVHRAPVAASGSFRNSYNSADGATGAFCSTEPGNPYNPETDYMGWSAWRAHGAWDGRNDCQ
jgi:hypothetical protein